MTSDWQLVASELTGADGAYPVTAATVRGVRHLVYAGAPNDVRSFLAPAAGRAVGVAIGYDREEYDWQRYTGDVLRLARALRADFGVRRGDRVAIAMRNYPEWPVAFWAIVTLGAIAVPLNAWLLAAELAVALQDSGTRVVLADAERARRIAAERPNLPELASIIVARPEESGTADAEYQEVLASQSTGIDLFEVAIDPDDDCTIMYTSGTTGRPKGAVATHRAHVANLMNSIVAAEIERQVAERRDGQAPVPPEHPAQLITGPLFHIAGLPSIMLNPYTGTRTVLMYKWDPQVAVELIERHRITAAHGVPTVIRQLLEAIDASGRELSSLRFVRTGGAQASSRLVAHIGTVLGGQLRTGTSYGLTETSGPMVQIGSADFYQRPLAVGVPLPTSQVRVVDEHGNDVGTGELGEAWFKGPNISRGYWGLSSGPAGAFIADGWFRSGDLVKRDELGFVYIVDRMKDIIIRAGENVYCSEAEEVLLAHPDVAEASVYGLPHELWGEEVAATVRALPGSTLTEADLRAYSAERLARFKVPTSWTLRDEPLPRNAAGKLLKRELRAAALAARQPPDPAPTR